MNHGTCIHYTGLISECCGAGVNYREAFDGEQPGIFLRLPCIEFRELPAHGRGTYIGPGEATVRKEFDRRGQTAIPCALRLEPTPEQVHADRVDSEKAIAKTMSGIKVGIAWKQVPKPDKDRHEVVECPVCNGRLHLSQSACNGHMSGKCETDGCVMWME